MNPTDINIEKCKEISIKIIDQMSLDSPEPKEQNNKNTNADSSSDLIQIVFVQIYRASKLLFYEINSLDLKNGDAVIVNTESGTELAYVIKGPFPISPKEVFPDGKIQKIIRIAQKNDFDEIQKTLAKEEPAYNYCLKLINSLKLEMKLVKVRYLFGCKKAIFYFTADGRVDFRQLVKELVANFKIRIELRQIGVRDETKLIGGLGSCGRTLCCCDFSREFPPVSIKMAKEQGLSLNPAKISGMCGRLLCCLNYEHCIYKELGKGIPKVGKKCIHEGKNGKILNINILSKKALILYDEGGIVTVNIDQLSPLNKTTKINGKANETQTLSDKFLIELKNEFSDLDILPFFEF